jgi:2-aminoadipate transaminase
VAARRDALQAALAGALPHGCRWQVPGGGFFIWVRLPDGLDSGALLPAAEAAGVAYAPGARFTAESHGRNCLRLAFTLLPPEQFEAGARRLGSVIRMAQGG